MFGLEVFYWLSICGQSLGKAASLCRKSESLSQSVSLRTSVCEVIESEIISPKVRRLLIVHVKGSVISFRQVHYYQSIGATE